MEFLDDGDKLKMTYLNKRFLQILTSNELRIPLSKYYEPNDICKIKYPFYAQRMKNVDTLHLPEDVTHIHMNCYSSGNINNMSDKIKFLKFSSFLTSKIKKFPASIETIILPQLYNRGIENMPESVKHIEFGDYFNKPIDFSRYKSLHTLIFGNRFNQPVTKWPTRMKKLVLGRDYNQILNNLPNSLQEIDLGSSFNDSIDCLPDSVLSIILGSSFNQIINKWPKSVTKVKFSYLNSNLIKEWADSITHLEVFSLFGGLNKWPKNLTHFKIGSGFKGKITNFPESITNLHIGDMCDHYIDNWPQNLELLILGDMFNQNIDNLPESVVDIKLGRNFSTKINKWPKGLTKLYVNGIYNHSLADLPSTVTHIVLENTNLIDTLPDTVTNLTIISINSISSKLPKHPIILTPQPVTEQYSVDPNDPSKPNLFTNAGNQIIIQTVSDKGKEKDKDKDNDRKRDRTVEVMQMANGKRIRTESNKVADIMLNQNIQQIELKNHILVKMPRNLKKLKVYVKFNSIKETVGLINKTIELPKTFIHCWTNGQLIYSKR
ncbi:FNIP repeat protein [Catovirus CTV1]|uniref:FNIP repeat protein n=1 Tax=Catovirus CTV1 TaxID=1977631 RepID=A0A1V0SA99_9VIRU|nr:FNIP repeat protein [Catovirus CTV1]